MRVLLVSANFRPHVGGIETFTETLASELAARGHEITVLCCRTDAAAPALEHMGSFEVVRLPASSWPERRLGVPYPIPAPRPLLRTLRRELGGADVVHVQDATYATSVAAILASRRAGVPVLVTQHVGFVPQGNPLLDATERAALAAAGPVARAATKVVAYNTEVAAWAKRRWRLPRVDVVPVGVPAPEEVEPLPREELGLAPGRLVALFVGRDVPKKGLDAFLGAADPAYDLVAVTDRRSEETRALMLPFRSRTELSRLFGAVDLLVLPSEAEGVPLVLQEAMAHGLPVAAAYSPGYSHAFSPSDVAVVTRSPASIRSTLLELGSDRSELARLASRSRAVASERFSLRAFADAYEQLYAGLV